jgi:hypothetical protein
MSQEWKRMSGVATSDGAECAGSFGLSAGGMRRNLHHPYSRFAPSFAVSLGEKNALLPLKSDTIQRTKEAIRLEFESFRAAPP